MTTYDFSPLFRSTIGFDRLAHQVENAMRRRESATEFPPYNIERHGEDRYRITLAVAGFGENDLAIEVKENTLTVTGKAPADDAKVTYLHEGITGGGFKRTFELADHVRVADAIYDRGLLHVNLVREVPERLKPRKIDISASSSPLTKAASKAKKLINGKMDAA
ncbi:MAG: Hsp20 family protein [Alphaproteobacteria bacterium]|nr:Hsp20 family protein [Alphaproteobacteria bacterium]